MSVLLPSALACVCPCCNDRFSTEAGAPIAALLQCGHSTCEACVEHMTSSESGNCSCCHHPTVATVAGSNSLLAAFASEAASLGGPGKDASVCEECLRVDSSLTTRATYVCCGKYCCDEHLGFHKKAGHMFKALYPLTNARRECPCHPGLPRYTFCFTCERAICAGEHDEKSHEGHVSEPLRTAHPQMLGHLTRRATQMRGGAAVLEAGLHTTLVGLETIEANRMSALEAVDVVRAEVVAALDERLAHVRGSIASAHAWKHAALTRQVGCLKPTISQLSVHADIATYVAEKGTDVSTADVLEVTKSVAGLIKPFPGLACSTDIRYVHETDLTNLIRAIKALGSVAE